ncbi:MAG: hypothetical protein WC554_16685 [Clostridia bacterium]
MRTVKAYKHTAVNWGKSQAQITKILEQQGVQDVRFTFLQTQNTLICEFNYPTKIENKDVNVGVRIVLPIPANDDRAKDQIHRALFYYLKTKFEALNFGLVEFIQEFMPHLIVFDKGVSKTMFQVIQPQYQKGLISGQQGEIKMLESKIDPHKKTAEG